MVHSARGGVLVRDGRIAEVGDGAALREANLGAEVTDHGAGLILPGFVDAHVHYPQTGIIASWGKRLIDWLNTYTFPEEMRFSDRRIASEIAERYLDLVLAHGTTTVASFCTIHTASVDAVFEAAAARGMAVVAGKTCMDRNAPEGLLDTALSAYDDSKRLISRWHGSGRARYAITPRFSPTSTREQLSALGALWAEHPDCLMQTHLSEQTEEVAWVADLFPEARDYLDTSRRGGPFRAPAPSSATPFTLQDATERARIAEPTPPSFTARPRIPSRIGALRPLLPATHAPPALATTPAGGSFCSPNACRTMAGGLRGQPASGPSRPTPAELLWLRHRLLGRRAFAARGATSAALPRVRRPYSWCSTSLDPGHRPAPRTGAGRHLRKRSSRRS